MSKAKILVIEDDPSISRLIALTLETQEYSYQVAKDGQEGLLLILSQKPDVIILDLGLPDMDGLNIIKKVRSWSNVPIIIVSARGEDADKIAALDEGADDYLTKPFSVEELLARIRVSLRRLQYEAQLSEEASRLFVNGRLQIDFLAQVVRIEGQEIHLTPLEYNLLCLLAKNIGKVLTYRYILKEVWGTYDDDASALRVFITTLRKKIEADPAHPALIQTHVGVGYRMLNTQKKG